MISQPRSLQEAIQMRAQRPGAMLMNGGTDVMVEINFGHRNVEDVISLRGVPELRQWSQQDGTVRIGAGIPYAELEQGPLAQMFPALAQAARTVGSPQIRAAGTIGGNLGTCSPAGDSLPVLFAHDAVVVLAHSNGERRIPVTQFMTGPKKNALGTDEIIAAVEMNVPQGFQAYSKVGVRNAMVISIASVCLVHDTLSRSLRLAMGTVGPTILRATETESWLAQQCDLSKSPIVSDSLILEFGKRCESECSPITDHRSTAEYRRHAIGVIASRLLERCAEQ